MKLLNGVIFLASFSIILAQNWKNIPLKSSITQVNPMIGLVFWDDNEDIQADLKASSLEYFYLPIGDLVIDRINGVLKYNWGAIDSHLEEIYDRGHQIVIRPRYEYPGLPTSVPSFLRKIFGYKGQIFNGTEFMDWRSKDLMQMHLDMFTAIAQRYDNDPRVFVVQSGFGFWSEYHLVGDNSYVGPPLQLGYNFPSAEFQVQSIKHILSVFKNTPVQYSIDMADTENKWCPLFSNISSLPYGAFDDSSFSKEYQQWNDANKARMGWKTTRYQTHPLGGEIAMTDQVQEHALDLNGPEGQSLTDYVKEYKYTFLIGDAQTEYHYNGPLTQIQRIKQVGQTFGYKFTATSFQSNGTHVQVTIKNTGVAPIYKDAYIQISGVRGLTTLKLLQPGASLTDVIKVSTATPTLKIVSPWITDKQEIQFEANL